MPLGLVKTAFIFLLLLIAALQISMEGETCDSLAGNTRRSEL